MKILFGELYVSNPEQRHRNLRMFYVVYKFWVGSVFQSVDKDVDEALMRDFFLTFWNLMYLTSEYDLAYREPDARGVVNPPEIEKRSTGRRVTPDRKISRLQVSEYLNEMKSALPAYRKHLSPQVFKTARYLSNLKRAEDREGQSRRFEVKRGFSEFGVPDHVEVYYVRKGLFRFYFIEENGTLKVLTLGFEL